MSILNIQDHVHYEVSGEGVPIIFCHAGFVDSGMWDEQVKFFSLKYQVIRYDMQGYGQSQPATKAISRRDELKQLMDKLNIEEAILVGCSISGTTVMDLALESPERVQALILVSMVPSGFEMRGEPPRHLFEMIGALQAGDLDTASELQTRIWFDGIMREPQDVDSVLRQKVKVMNRQALLKQGSILGDAQPLNPLDPPASNRLADISQPTLILTGEVDHPEVLRASQVMDEAIPNAQTHVLSASGHLPNMEQPSEFNQVVDDFLNLL